MERSILQTSTDTTKKGNRYYFPVVLEINLQGQLTTHAFTPEGVSLDSVFPSTVTNMRNGSSYTTSVPTNPQYEYVGYKEVIDGVPGSLIAGSKPPVTNYDGSYDTKNINLYYAPLANVGTIHVRHMVRTSASGSFVQKGQEDVSANLPDSRTVSPTTSYGNVLGSSLSYSSYSDTMNSAKTVTTSLTTSQKQAWVTFFYENAGSSVTGDFDILPGPKIKNGDQFVLHPKDFNLQACTYTAHRFKIEKDGRTYTTPDVTDQFKDNTYANKNAYPPMMTDNGIYNVSLQIVSSCGTTSWIGPKTLELTDDDTYVPPSMPSGPEARIAGPTKVKAGQPLPYPIDGLNSFDWDNKDIVMYTWDHRIAGTSPYYDITEYDTPGTYTVTLTVKNSSGAWSEDDVHTIEVVPNEPPVALLSVPSEGTRLGTTVVQSNAFSPDGDAIVSHKFQMKYDANNNGFADDAWQTVQEGSSPSYSFKPSRVGNYLFGEVACEVGNICDNTDDQPESERKLWIDNLAPTADVKTSSPVNDPDTRTPLPMDNLYNTGSIINLDTGAAGNKGSWQVSQGELQTKTYRTDLGMFNEAWGTHENYYGDDFLSRTLYSSIQNQPTLQSLGTFLPLGAFVRSDEKYVYVAYTVSSTRQIRVDEYSKDLQLIRSNTSAPLLVEYDVDGLMVKGEKIYVTSWSRNYGNGRLTFIFDRETLALSTPKPLAFSFWVDRLNNGTYANSNTLLADSKGLIGQSYSNYDYNAYEMRANIQFYGTDADRLKFFRLGYDYSTLEPYVLAGSIYSQNYSDIKYVSQKTNSVYRDSSTGRLILYNSNLVQVGSLQDPPEGHRNYNLLGVDENRNYYSVAYTSVFNSTAGIMTNPYIFVHDSTGKWIRSWQYPLDMTKDDKLTSSSGYDSYYKVYNYVTRYTVDRKGNIWTASAVRNNPNSGNYDGYYAIALTPNGEEKKLLSLPISKEAQVFDILIGADGLVTYFMYCGDHQLRVIVFDPDTYQIVRDDTIGNFWTFDPSFTYTWYNEVYWMRNNNGDSITASPYYVIPLADQKYLIASYADMNGVNQPRISYLLSASGSTAYPKAFEVGTPEKDLWLGGNVSANLAFQGDVRVDNSPTAGVGFIYLAQDPYNNYSAEFEDGQFKIKKTVGGSTSTVFAKSYVLVQGQTYNVRFVPVTGGFDVYVNQIKQATISESSWTRGKYGVLSRGQQGAAFTNASTDAPGKEIGSVSGVVLVGETLNYDVIMNDPEKDPRVAAAETWTYTHNPNVFLQPQGTWGLSGQAVTAPVTSFSLPGEYTFTFRTKDDPNPDYLYPSNVFADYRKESNVVTGKIRVHRRPVAVPGVTVNASQQLTYTDNSYDPDRYNPATGQYSTEATGIDYATTHGIVDRQWRYRLQSSSTYYDGQPTRLSAGKYVIEENVVDEYGANSGWVAVSVDVQGYTALPPIAGFTLSLTTTYRGVPVTINSTASDPQDGDRTNLEHQFFVRNVTAGDSETLQSDVRTSWDKLFSSLGVMNIRQLVRNSYGLTAEANHTVTIVNRKPAVNINVPASANSSNPTLVTTLRPEIDWTYSDLDGDPQAQWQIQIFNNSTDTLRTDTGARSGSNLTWTPTADLDDQTVYYVQARVFDGYDWSDWSAKKYFRIETNKPPTADFNWSPALIYEGDPVTISTIVGDPDRDSLVVSYVIESPSGARRTISDTRSYPYSTAGPAVTALEPGVWTATLSVSDGKAPPVAARKTFRVWPLGVSGQVRHTEEWEANRQHYNEEHPGAERPANWFWAGEAIVLEAMTTDTGASVTKASAVAADAGGGLRKTLTAANPPVRSIWQGKLGSADAGFPLATLAEGDYLFTFTATYSNGVVKTAQAAIHVEDTVDDYVQVHRVQ